MFSIIVPENSVINMSAEDMSTQATSQDSTMPPSNPTIASLNRQDDDSSNSLPSDFLTSSVPLPQPPENPANTVPSKTLWMGDLEAWWDENYIVNLWAKLGKHVEVKVIKPKHNLLMHQLAKTNGQGNVHHSGYCFVEFDSPEQATDALLLNGTIIHDTNNKSFRLNWASAATLDSQIAQTPEYSLFVGDLSAGTTEAHLLALFQSHFNSIKTVRVMTDPSTGLSRCFGFVRFSSEEDRRNALVEMNGKWLGGRQIRVALATPKHQNYSSNNYNGHHNKNNNNNNMHMQSQFQRNNSNNNNNNQTQIPMDQSIYMNTIGGPMSAAPIGFYPPFTPSSSGSFNNIPNSGFNDLNNTTVFVGGLANGLNEDTLLALFEPFGQISNVKVPPGKGCGFVKFVKREDAENAIESMQGFVIGGSRVRLSWGRPSNKNFQRQPQQQHQHHPMYMNNSNLGNNMSNNLNMNSVAFNPINNNTNNSNNTTISSGGNNFTNQSINTNNSDSNENDPGMNTQMPNLAMFNGQNATQQIMPRAMYDYGQGIPQHAPHISAASHGNVARTMISPNQIPQQLESYSETTPQGTHATLVGIPAGMPPPFIYDPYFAVQQQGNNMNIVAAPGPPAPPPTSDDVQGGNSPQLTRHGMMEVPKGVIPIHGIPPQQYVIDQHGQYVYLSTQPPFTESTLTTNSPPSGYDDNSSVVNGSENNNNSVNSTNE